MPFISKSITTSFCPCPDFSVVMTSFAKSFACYSHHSLCLRESLLVIPKLAFIMNDNYAGFIINCRAEDLPYALASLAVELVETCLLFHLSAHFPFQKQSFFL